MALRLNKSEDYCLEGTEVQRDNNQPESSADFLNRAKENNYIRQSCYHSLSSKSVLEKIRIVN